MINLQDYLKENVTDCGSYAKVETSKGSEIVWFTRYDNLSEEDEEPYFLESPCFLHKIFFGESKTKFCDNYVDNEIKLEKGVNREDFIRDYVLPMIRGNVFYEIENPQVEPFLPKEVLGIELLSETQCLDALLEKETN